MSNNKQSSVEWLYNEMVLKLYKLQTIEYTHIFLEELEQAKAMQQKQAQLYATFVLKCVNNNLPPITFNDWINLENNDQQ
jgi:hypothetical protein